MGLKMLIQLCRYTEGLGIFKKNYPRKSKKTFLKNQIFLPMKENQVLLKSTKKIKVKVFGKLPKT